MTTVLSEVAAPWWESVEERGGHVAVVLGLRGSGKTAWFAQLADRAPGDVVLWPVMRLARARRADEVWRHLWAALGLPAHDPADDTAGDPVDHLDLHLDDRGRDLTLVVDDWDNALGPPGESVPDACYEVLDQLARYCLGQQRERGRRVFLRVVLLTSLPAATDLLHFARTVHRPTFERLSGLVTRSFAVERFPLLDRAASEELLAGEGLSRRNARRVAAACGGWPWLLRRAAAAAMEHGNWTPAAAAHVREVVLPELLHECLFRHLVARPEVLCAPIDYLARELRDGRVPSDFGLPPAFDDPARVAPLVRQLLQRSFLVVDTENIRMPFQRHCEAEPGAYPGGVERFLRDEIGSWLRQLGVEQGIAGDDVWFVGRSSDRIDGTVGPQTLGQREFLPDGLRHKVRRRGESDNTDDTVLTSLVVQLVERHPLARVHVVTGDSDAPLIIDQRAGTDRVVVHTPWRAARSVREILGGTGRLVENCCPVDEPRHRDRP